MKKLFRIPRFELSNCLLLFVLLLLVPIATHAQTTFTQKVNVPTTPPTVASSKYPGFEGCKQWGKTSLDGSFGDTVIFQCKTTDPSIIRNCSVVENIGGESGSTLDGTCETVQNGKITTQGSLVDGGLGAQSKTTDTTGKTTTVGGAGQTNISINASNATAPAAQNPPDNSCSMGTNLICDLTQGFLVILQNIIFAFMEVTSFLLGIVGVLFNWLVVITIFQFGVFFGNSQGMLLAWGILRDLGNILILFGFIYAGVMMVLDLHSFDARKAIPRLIIFAVLMNFSLFTGEAVVDVANVLSAKIYQEAGQSVFQKCGNTTTLTDCTNQVGIAEVIIQDTGLGGAYSYGSNGTQDTTSSGAVNNLNPDHLHVILAFTAVIILMSIVMILLLAASVMLLLRAITLVILLVTSPIGFAGFAIPQLESQAKKWWETLISNALFAPIFLLLLFVGLKVMDGLRQSIAGTSSQTLISALSQPNASVGSILIVFALIIGFFIAALMFAKSSGTAGATFATSWAQKTVVGAWSNVGNTAGGAARWTYGFGARNTVGRYVPKAATAYNEKFGQWKAQKGIGGWAARTFDYAAGDQITGGLTSVGNKKFGGQRSYNEAKAHEKHRDHETHDARQKADRFKTAKNVNAPIVSTGDSVKDADAQKKKDLDLSKAIGAMTQAEKEQYVATLKTNDEISSVARILSQSDYDALQKNDKLDHHLRDQLKEFRFDEHNAPYVISKMSPKAVTALPGGTLTKEHILKSMNGRQLATIDPAELDPDNATKVVNFIKNTPSTDPDDAKSEDAKKRFKALVGNETYSGVSIDPNARSRWSEFFPSAASKTAASPSSGPGSKSFT